MNQLDPATTFVRSLDGDFYMVREAADILGVNHRTLRNFNDGDDENLKPSFLAWLGKVKIYLYTEDDLLKLRDYFADRKRVYPNDARTGSINGRPARFTKEDRKERQKLYSKAHYYGKRAKEMQEKGDLRNAATYLAKQRQVKKELENWPTTESPSGSRTKRPSTATARGSSSSTPPTSQKESSETTT